MARASAIEPDAAPGSLGPFRGGSTGEPTAVDGETGTGPEIIARVEQQKHGARDVLGMAAAACWMQDDTGAGRRQGSRFQKPSR